MTITSEHRERFEMLGYARVKRMVETGQMVQHLNVPAMHWLDEFERKDNPDAPDKRQQQGGDVGEHSRDG